MARKDLPVDKMAAAYQKGKSLREVADQFGTNMNTAKRAIVASGVQIRTKSEAMSSKGRQTILPVNQIAKLYENGRTLRQLGQQFGTSATTVRRNLEDLGVKRRAPGRRSR